MKRTQDFLHSAVKVDAHPYNGGVKASVYIDYESMDSYVKATGFQVATFANTSTHHDEVIRLSYWETPEEAFEEYKRHKQADILIMADKYKNKVPKKVYDALLKVEVRPYVEEDSKLL